MSTITTLTSTDTGSVSMGVINTNFSNLNTDKIEATQTVALTNKTIDADLNTITDLTPTNIKTGNKTGLDTSIVTGTKGDANELAQWNSDGDLITTDVSITTAQPSSSSNDVTIPTSKAVYEAIQAEIVEKQIFVPVLHNTASATSNPNGQFIGQFPYATVNATQAVYFSFHVPVGYTTLTSVELVLIPDATETLTMTQCTVAIAAAGEVYNVLETSTGSQTKAVTTSQITKWQLDNLTNTPFQFMAANDMVGVMVTAGTTLFRVVGLLVKYT